MATPASTPALRRLSRWLQALVLHNLGFKILALAIAILLWGLVREEQDLEEMVDVYLKLERPEDMLILDQVPQFVTVRVSGPRSRLRLTEETKLEMLLDLSGAVVGENTFNIDSHRIRNLPNDVRVAAFYPSVLTLNVDWEGERELPIEVKTTGVLPEDITLLSAEATPERITLKGARSQLERLQSISTQAINLRGIRRNTDRVAKLDFGDLYAWPKDKDQDLQVQIKVKQETAAQTLAEVPVSLDKSLSGRKLTPDKIAINVSGPKSQVEALGPEHVRATLKLAKGQQPPATWPATVRYGAAPADSPLNLEVAITRKQSSEVQVEGVVPGTLELAATPTPAPSPAAEGDEGSEGAEGSGAGGEGPDGQAAKGDEKGKVGSKESP